MRSWPALAFLCALVCAGCAPPSPSAEPLLIAHALQLDAPATAATRDGIAFVWSGFDAVDVHQDARLLSGDRLSEPVVLPLPPSYPFEQTLIAGTDGALHLFWLDAARDGGGHRLYAALLAPDLSVQRGPVEVSDAPTYRYSVMSDGAGGAWAVWSGGAAGEPALTLRRVDVLGRPLAPRPLGVRGDFPALAAADNGAVLLFWRAEGQLWRMPLVEGAGGVATAVSAGVGLWPGDRLARLWAAQCGDVLCVGWTVVRAGDSADSWLSAGRSNADFWPPPQQLDGLSWLTPERQPALDAEALTAIAQTADGLALVRLRDGRADIGPLFVEGTALQGSPGLIRTAQEWLITWAEAGPEFARLLLARQPVS
jgi:hypothetical protein